ncbi:DnaK suppressor protein [Rhodobacteraceae bacterium MBR-64]|jgi:DnaK suppressor protein
MNEAPSSDHPGSRFKLLLQAELADLRAQSRETSANRAPVSLDQQSVGRLSRMDAMQAQSMATAMEDRRRRRISQIELALRRIEDDDFGFCDDCGEFIGEKRLGVDPVARRCVSCAR